MRTHDMNKLVYDLYFRIQAVSGYATLTAYSYGSKSVTQPDASPKRYLWDKKNTRTDINSRPLQATVIV